ncbi:hypothetical protein [Pseudidiomarina woesei]|uniref:Uncharacterized protein n=1 Tax=Pseudidiomarina woesei TaxID=1381080 RepID=A0A0K6H0N9_9GAMM|nr:hypothetical protein [Pseudidiomarina woesei]CUA84445.1 hypothetical protein Ga0061064_0903 [Pseudidiomarina woesei]
MAARRSWKPLLIAALVIVMLALAWLPTGELDPEQRSNKPFLHVTYTIDAASDGSAKGFLEDVAFDIQQRIEQRHEWRLSETAEPRAWQLTVQVTSGAMLVLSGELEAPASNNTQASVQRFKVQGPKDSYAALPEQYVKILIQLVENGHKAQSSL